MQRRSIQNPAPQTEVEAFAAALRAGDLVVLPTETVYGLAADATNPEAVDRLRAAKGRADTQPFTHHLSGIAAMDALAAPTPPRIRRFLDRVWPGPLTAIVPGLDGSPVGLRVPSHPFTTAVLEALGHSAFMTSVNPTGAAPLNDPDAIEAAFGGTDSIALLADAGPPRLGEASAVARLDGRAIEVLRPGILDEQDLLVGFAAKVLFVCTGNTCRSPLAEILAQQLCAERLGIEPAAVLRHGLCFVSAGTGTMSGMPASEGSRNAGAERGLDLEGHRSTQLHPDLVAEADRIYCLSSSHRRVVLTYAPEAEAKTFLLDPAGGDVADPFGGSLEVYRGALQEIEAHLTARLDEFLAL